MVNLAGLLGITDLEELSPAAQLAAHRDAVWAERAHWNDHRNVQRREAFEANKALARSFEPPHWMGPEQAKPVIAPTQWRRRRRRSAKLYDLAKARKRA